MVLPTNSVLSLHHCVIIRLCISDSHQAIQPAFMVMRILICNQTLYGVLTVKTAFWHFLTAYEKELFFALSNYLNVICHH